ncbi:PREDICTED: uncharacterized protein LOC109156634 [Ipomoea nil]|uniref:uncharacterized protein LOC109156634 n=1 Tax=Ipomoea nil TaxID=35883 RepID=UPI00090172F7|nr:PREDICTED: uncharacterized protein LOC109156634 [Ipomoea nil]
MKREGIQAVKTCDVCQRYKEENVAYPGLLQPLSVPEQAWQSISMDFIEGLPKSHGKDVIMVVVDRFTKYSHFLALAHPYTAEMVVEMFMENIYKLHGVPKDIVNDRDRVFVSKFWREVFKKMQVNLSMSSSYHPQSDGQTERVNRSNIKLTSRFYGPYEVIEKVGKVAYKLRLPGEAAIHRVFHVSLLKKGVGAGVEPQEELPTTDAEGMVLTRPVAALGKGMVKRNNAAEVEILVQWANLSEEAATWENYHHVIKQFPNFNPWGQGSNEGEGNVMILNMKEGNSKVGRASEDQKKKFYQFLRVESQGTNTTSFRK